jgi:hypothetical protein
MVWHLAIVKTITLIVLANKKSYSCWLFGFVGAENSKIKICRLQKIFPAIFGTYKSNANTTDVCGLLQRTLICSYENKIFTLIIKLNRSGDWGL